MNFIFIAVLRLSFLSIECNHFSFKAFISLSWLMLFETAARKKKKKHRDIVFVSNNVLYFLFVFCYQRLHEIIKSINSKYNIQKRMRVRLRILLMFFQYLFFEFIDQSEFESIPWSSSSIFYMEIQIQLNILTYFFEILLIANILRFYE